ncbi:MAG TPA: M23 family metallopeptidase [Candidatus Binatia bacterium]|jgi:hypothetical protein
MTKGLRIVAVTSLLACAVTIGMAVHDARAEMDGEPAQHLPYYVVMDPPIVYPGAVIRLQVRPPAGAGGGTVTVAGRRYLGQIEDGMFVVYFAVDIDTLPGPYEMTYDVGSRHGSRVVTVRPRRMDDEARNERPISRDDLALEDLARSNPRLVSLWNRITLDRYWNGAFESPSSGPMVATFAMRRTSEESLGDPHTGVDLAARPGSDIAASAQGIVALVADVPGSKIVVLDHGLGLYTYYAGLGDVYVSEGDWVHHGAPIGRMPANSRAALHFGARLAGAQVDPTSLPGITLRVPEISGEHHAPKEEKDKKSDYDF